MVEFGLIETPEGPNIDLVTHSASYAKINEFGFIETPYIEVQDGHVTENIVYLTADQEEQMFIAQASTKIDQHGFFLQRNKFGSGMQVKLQKRPHHL